MDAVLAHGTPTILVNKYIVSKDPAASFLMVKI
jgi:hypothetical protein